MSTSLERAARVMWPFVTRRRLDALLTENYTLRDALREANAELLKHRTLIAGLRTGRRDMTEAIERAILAPASNGMEG